MVRAPKEAGKWSLLCSRQVSSSRASISVAVAAPDSGLSVLGQLPAQLLCLQESPSVA